MKAPLEGGAPTELWNGPGSLCCTTLAATHVYWANSNGSVAKVPVDGGAVVELATGQMQPKSPVVDARNAYWSVTEGMIRRIAK